MLNMLFNSSLAPLTLRFTYRAWLLGKTLGCVTGGGTRFSIKVTWINLTNCEARTRSGCNETTISGSMTFCSRIRGGGLLVVRAMATTSCTTEDLVALDPSITENCKNWRSRKMRKQNWDYAWSNQDGMNLRVWLRMLSLRWSEEVTNYEIWDRMWIHGNHRNQKSIRTNNTTVMFWNQE